MRPLCPAAGCWFGSIGMLFLGSMEGPAIGQAGSLIRWLYTLYTAWLRYSSGIGQADSCSGIESWEVGASAPGLELNPAPIVRSLSALRHCCCIQEWSQLRRASCFCDMFEALRLLPEYHEGLGLVLPSSIHKLRPRCLRLLEMTQLPSAPIREGP